METELKANKKARKEGVKNLTPQEVDEELFRELDCSWERKDLIKHIISSMDDDDKRSWIYDYLNEED